MTATTRPELSVSDPMLYVAFELGKKDWKLAMTAGFGIEPWLQTVASGDLDAVVRVLRQARQRFTLSAAAAVVSCYEAGRDGFWIHRALTTLGVVNRVVDSASIEVNRRARRAKTDRLDAEKLVRMLVRVCCGERGVWREVRVPTVAQEAARQVSRERTDLTKDQSRLINQVRSWLATWGTTLPKRRGAAWWTTVRDGMGAPLPVEVQERLARADARLQAIATQIAALETTQRAGVTAAAAAPPAEAPAAPAQAVRQLVRLKGVATTSASVLVDEGLVWRAFQNRRQIGGFLGFAPTPYNSGESQHEQGISGAGNARLQAVSIQLAWNWVRWQPESALTQWYQAKFGTGKRARRIGIVAVARKLVIALWRYVTAGIVPTGARLKVASGAAPALTRVARTVREGSCR